MSETVTIKMVDRLGVIPKLEELAYSIPRECERAQLRAASIMPRKIIAAMRTLNLQDAGGALPKLADISKSMRGGKPGGKLTSDKSLCRVMNVNRKLVAGFVGGVSNIASLWQDGGSRPLSIYERRYMHIVLARRGIRNITVPTVADQPKRLVIEPLAAKFEREIPKWITGALTSIINKKIARNKR